MIRGKLGAAKVLALSVGAVILSSCTPAETSSSDHLRQAGALDRQLGIFLSEPGAEVWVRLCAVAERDPTSSIGQVLLSVKRYNDARIARDFPNSMARMDVTPNEAVAASIGLVETELGLLRHGIGEPGSLALLKVLILQGFDDQLRYSACEILCRTNPVAYRKLTCELPGLSGNGDGLAQIMLQVSERWNSAENALPKGK
jgi:hypothetical protein